MQTAAKRLRYIAAVTSINATLFLILDLISPPTTASPVSRLIAIAAPVFAALNGLTLLWLCSRLQPRALLEVAPLYQVVQGLLISLYYHAAPVALRDASRGWSAIAVWVLVFPILIPNTRRKVVFATLATAAMDPVGLLVHVAAGAPVPTLAMALRAMVPVLLAGFLSIFLSHLVHELTVAVKRARDLGSYHLVSPIGRGGMGEVWRAQHRMLARPAAIKLIRPDNKGGAPRDLLVRFEREAQATAALRSPHTVEVYDFGTTEDGAFYYVMELLSGLDADTLVRRHGPLPPERAVYLLRQACRSLEEAHAREFVHRDIKPANIFVCRYGLEYDFVKVLDFGLVKSVGFAEERGVTATEVVAGTPDYMAPEIARGERHFDHRADLYSLGCVAYWLLSGQPVFEARTPNELMIDHVRTPPPRPRSGAEFRFRPLSRTSS
jgi:hypothetical protein